MNLSVSESVPRKRFLRRSLYVMRPLSWWLILVLVLYAIRTHQRLSQEMRLTFDASVEGKRSDPVMVSLDGSPIVTGSRVGVGHHRISFTNRKAETVSTNIFVWYGGLDMGEVLLKRNRGNLVLWFVPPARDVIIAGPELRIELTNTVGLTSSVPTDTYGIIARWLNHSETNHIAIMAGRDTAFRCAPSLGAVTIQSEPAGARVIDRDGKDLGATPLTLNEVTAGHWRGTLKLDGYAPANINMRVVSSQTNSFQTNLVSWKYAQAIEDARRLYTSRDYDRAIEAVNAALKSGNEAEEAKALYNKVAFARYMQRGRNFYEGSHYADARKEFEGALNLRSEDADAKSLFAEALEREGEVNALENQRRAKELALRTRSERLAKLDATMSSITHEHLQGDLFGVHRMTFTNTVKDLNKAIEDALSAKFPRFEIGKSNWIDDNLFAMEAKQDVPGGFRQCLIVGTQAADNESIVVFRVFEYETHLNVNVGGFFHISDGQPPLVAVPNKGYRVEEGIEIVTSRIKSAGL